MKKSILIFLIISGFATLFSCKKDEVGPVLDPGSFVNPTLQGFTQNQNFVFNPENADSIIKFNWTGAIFGPSLETTYTIQIARAGTNFLTPKDILTSTSNQDSLKVSDLNNKVLLIEDDEENPVALDIEMRITANVNDSVQTLYSEVIVINIDPYYVPIVYPSLWVPGAYQSWSPATAKTIGSVKSDGKYEGYIYFTPKTPFDGNFKFTSAPDWAHTNYGKGTAPGTLSTNGSAGNLSVPVPGYYKCNVDVPALTYTTLKTDWAIVGTATGEGWDVDKVMTFDEASWLLTATLNLVAGEIKFRANGTNDLIYGDDLADKKLDLNGVGIQIPTDGNYTITLNLTKPVYKYILIKN